MDRFRWRGARWVMVVALVATAPGMAGCGSSKSATVSPAAVATTAAADVHAVAAGDGVGTSTSPDGSSESTGRTRDYFIAADEVQWDYAPSGRNLITGGPFTPDEDVFVEPAPDRIGRVYKKSVYHEYTDDSFTKLKERPADEAYLGDLGPTLHAEVGDSIVVLFKNNTGRPVSMHPHGVFYDKDSEGAPYEDGTSGADRADDAVPPGGTHRYVWNVPERAGPGPMDPSSVMWMYHSHADEVGDVYAGLVGTIIVTKRGMARTDGTPIDVDRELIVNFEVDDENKSVWAEENAAGLEHEAGHSPFDDDEFIESNLMHSMNGFVYGNLPGLTMQVGQHVRWYLMSMGTEVDLHTPHWHGNTVVANGMRADVVGLLPAQMIVADMVPDDPGTWLFHCHVNDHLVAGMAATYTVSAA